VLGPIVLGEGARIGSNAVVIKPVPAGATVVGVPGRLVESRTKTESSHREEMARKMGFDAYGATQDAPDPVAHAINCMLDHVAATDKKMANMCKVLKGLGYTEEAEDLPDLESCEIVSTAEKESLDQSHIGESGGAVPTSVDTTHNT